ncbi:hypothetical protein RvY_00606 [Ramazzottius varieornatus]|uniref:Large ribosomal subunit protein mL62 n=1 Tax=Ramazzottius varieornatus TaxID=947166 RepID=A0A1D1UNR3_RAMVA|nr:hypothetical protein RvY_00606 [Ramazzottius varieornatus]
MLPVISRLLRSSVPRVHHHCRCGFKSIYSLDKLYPNSKFDYTGADNQYREAAEKSETFHGYIPVEELQVSYSRSSGPGGQNVNKVNTKVDVRFDIEKAKWIPNHLKPLLREKHNTRITKEGEFFIQSDKTRSRDYNMADCLDKIRYIIRQLEHPEVEVTPEDEAIIAYRQRKAAAERLREKRDNSLKKEARRMDNF